MKKLLLGFLIALSLPVFSQLTVSPYTPYYEQRKSLFEQMPVKRGAIVFLGNSITDGGEWAEMFNNKRVINRGISGDITAGILNRLDEVIRHKPKKVFLLIGINDLARGIANDSVFENICLIINKIKSGSPKPQLYIQSIFPVNDAFPNHKNHVTKTPNIIYINNLLRNYCEKQHIVFINVYDALKLPNERLNPEYTNDGLHLTGKGYQRWAEVIKPYVK